MQHFGISFLLYSPCPTCVQGLLYHIAIGTQGPPLQAFISAGFSPTQSPAPLPSLTPPRVRHTTSLLCTPGPHCAEHWGTQSGRLCWDLLWGAVNVCSLASVYACYSQCWTNQWSTSWLHRVPCCTPHFPVDGAWSCTPCRSPHCPDRWRNAHPLSSSLLHSPRSTVIDRQEKHKNEKKTDEKIWEMRIRVHNLQINLIMNKNIKSCLRSFNM